MVRIILFCVSLIYLYFPNAYSEPWVSNRYAQNCAGCHAPGRFNRPPRGRRCTLSCQGCHVNPNGGGLRNHYGQWNQQRWLKSFHSSTLKNKYRPAPYKKQLYSDAKAQSRPTLKKLAISSSSLDYPESAYERTEDTNWKKDSKTLKEYLSTIPDGDPYRTEREFSVTAGGDIRYLYGKQSGDVLSEDYKNLSFLMGVDLGIRVRPIKENLSFVFENRNSNNPANKDLEQGFTSTNRVRSAYVLVDDIAYNSYIMAGLYRPMFGNYTADHTSISQQTTDLDQNAIFKAVGIGLAPNVPFFNINFIQPMAENTYNQESGMVVNVGGRFVTLGASIKFSYWKTTFPKSDDPTKKLNKEMTALTLGGALLDSRIILNGELVNFTIQENDFSSNSGTILTFEGKYRFWREVYGVVEFSKGNTSITRVKGSADGMGIGLKVFAVPGLDLEMKYSGRKYVNDVASTTNDIKVTTLQAHMYF